MIQAQAAVRVRRKRSKTGETSQSVLARGGRDAKVRLASWARVEGKRRKASAIQTEQNRHTPLLMTCAMVAPYEARSRWLAQHVLPHEATMRARLRHLTRRSDVDVDDIVQETYAILARLESVDAIRNPRGYAMQVATSVFLQTIRRKKVVAIGSMSDLASLDAIDDVPSPEQQVSGQQELRRVQAAIGLMPPQVRKVFWLRRVEGLSQRETAHRLCLSEHTIEKYMSRGIRILLGEFVHGGNAAADASTLEDATPAAPDSVDGQSRTGP